MKKEQVEFEVIRPSAAYIEGNDKAYALGKNDEGKWFVAWGIRDALSKAILPVDTGNSTKGVKWFPEKKQAVTYIRSKVKEIYLPLMNAAVYKEERDCFFRRFVNPDFYPSEEPEVEELKNEAIRLKETLGTVNAIDVYNESAVYGFGSFEGSVGPWIAEGDFKESLDLARSLAEKIKVTEGQIKDLQARWPAHSVQPHFIRQLEDLEEELESLRGVKERETMEKHIKKEG